MRAREADAICVADLHLRDTKPLCRTDNYWEAQERKVAELCQLQRKHGCPLLVAGDVFDVAKPSPFLLQWALKNLPPFICVPGQHDLPQHSMDLYDRSGLAVLEAGHKATVLREGKPLGLDGGDRRYAIQGFPWGAPMAGASEKLTRYIPRRIAIMHRFIANVRAGWQQHCDQISEVFEKMTEFDLIVCGDNHVPFTSKHQNGGSTTLLVNPGSFMRMSADQAEYQPRVYLWFADTNEVTPVYLPIEKDVVDRSHIDEPQERDERLEAYVEKLNKNIEVGVSFEKNMEDYLRANKVEEPVVKKVYAAMEGKDAQH